MDESAAARERVRLAKWLVDQPESVRVGLDELAALDRADEDEQSRRGMIPSYTPVEGAVSPSQGPGWTI